MILGLIPALSGLLGKAIDRAIPDKTEANRLKSEINAQLIQLDAKELDAAQAIIVAEAQGESPVQRNWRPHLMYLIMFLLVFNGVVVPIGNVMFGVEIPVLEAWDAIPGPMWNLLTIGLGGYIAGRSGEKMIKHWRQEKGAP